jgi:hypothetical protein
LPPRAADPGSVENLQTFIATEFRRIEGELLLKQDGQRARRGRCFEGD